MEIQHLAPFVLTSVALMFIPGVDMALVTRQVVMHGRRAAFGTVGGLLVGGLTHAALATIGLSAVLLASATAYTTVKILGAAYLMGLGIQTIWTSWRRRNRDESLPGTPTVTKTAQLLSLRRAFLLGFISDVTNPKVAVFFLTFLPQFVTPGSDANAEIALLGLLFNAIATSWWIGYVFLLDRVSEWLRRPVVHRVIENVTGTVLVGLGIRVACERR